LKKLISGNEAVAYGALHAGVHAAAGYPGTPSTGCIASLLAMGLEHPYVEWSVNEKVALEVAAGVAWSGLRALCTMKMSGLNVAYDTLISIAYSGCEGGLVVYVADDPGANAGMCEQDSRGFAMMADMPMLEPASAAEAYTLTRYAFELSEAIQGPVFVRLTTAVAESLSLVELGEPDPPQQTAPRLIKDIQKYTKAGAAIATAQHRAVIQRLVRAGEEIAHHGINRLALGEPGGLGVIACGVTAAYLDEGLELLAPYGLRSETVSRLELRASHPFPTGEARRLLANCETVLVLEELEPQIERSLYVEAQQSGFRGSIVGKLDGRLSRSGEYGVRQVVDGLEAALHLGAPADLLAGNLHAVQLAAARPITVCAGCPHRGVYLAVAQAIRKLRLKKDQVMVTGDIGCTILGINPPFDLIWNEVSMGAGVSLAQGFLRAGVNTPIVATIGDSTFFHGGIPGLVNAVQHQADLTLIIMDNRWTAMTGMQVNPGTPCQEGAGWIDIDIAAVVPALGVKQFWIVNPFEVEQTGEVIREAMSLPGVKVVLARQECAIQALRGGKTAGKVSVIAENCNLCKLCLMATGCAALSLGEQAIEIDGELCNGCGVCVEYCHREALAWEAA
jgi:indolepyruvate ferredoxin oxidoreductase alpha subunit